MDSGYFRSSPCRFIRQGLLFHITWMMVARSHLTGTPVRAATHRPKGSRGIAIEVPALRLSNLLVFLGGVWGSGPAS